jgi:hypothetical protein
METSPMIRALIASALLVVSAAPLAAQSLDEQFQSAMAIFRPTGGAPEDIETLHETITRDLGGKWFGGMTALMPRPGGPIEPAIFRKACDNLGQTINVTPFQILFAMPIRRKDVVIPKMVITTFTENGGGLYSFQVDPERFLERVGMDDPERLKGRRAIVLRGVAGLAHLYRVSKDILVIHKLGDRPEIFARCPS